MNGIKTTILGIVVGRFDERQDSLTDMGREVRPCGENYLEIAYGCA